MSKTVCIFGGDGYLGWSVALAIATRTDHQVIVVDNCIKRKWEREVNAMTLVDLLSPAQRVAQYQKLFGKNNLSFEHVDLREYDQVYELIEHYRPAMIINAAQQPSAPFSMIDPAHARTTFETNFTTNLNALWAIATLDPNITYLKLGSAGCFLGIDTDCIPDQKVDFSFSYQNQLHRLFNSWLPMYATDFYHQSKISDFLVSDWCSELWELSVVTIQQSTIFGATIPENEGEEYHCLATRFNYDAIFGTVLNRFACQAAIGHPLTIYGDGCQKTGVVGLRRTVDVFLHLSEQTFAKGHTIVHNVSYKLSIEDLARRVAAVSGCDICTIANPRVEREARLARRFQPSRILDSLPDDDIDGEIQRLVGFAVLHKDRILPDLVMPRVNWRKGVALVN